MKKIILPFIVIISFFSSCLKEEINLEKVNKIIISGQLLNSETGNRITGKDLFGLQPFYRRPNNKSLIFSPIDAIKSDGSYEFMVDSAELYIPQQAINFFAIATFNDISCDKLLKKCNEDFTFKIPFSAFQQKQKGSTLYLNYDIQFTPQSILFLDISGLKINDSLRISADYINPCSMETHPYVWTLPTKSFSDSIFSYFNQIVPNREYKFTISAIKGNSIIKTQEWAGKLTTHEEKRVPIKLD
jgi:hypothetical protein